MGKEKHKEEYMRLGWVVFVGLALLTVAEFGIVIWLGSGILPYLAVIVLFKAGLILYYFMHIGQLRLRRE
jgi:hypothetical protein